MSSSESSIFSSENDSYAGGNDSTLSQKSDTFKPNRFIGCYLLVSRSEERRSAGRTYVGFTLDPPRRIKQHNGLTKHGGAKRTKRHRPWEMVAVVHGFASKTQGLQFEWAWQNPFKSVALKIHFGRPNALALPTVKRKSVTGCLQILAAMVSTPPWCFCPLTLTICAPREQWEEFSIQSVVFPKHLRVDFCSLPSLAANVSCYNYRHAQDSVTPRQISGKTSLCPVCKQQIPYSGWSPEHALRKISYCALCGVVAHVACFAQCREPDDGTLALDNPLLPDNVRCRACKGQVHWSLVVRLSRALLSEED